MRGRQSRRDVENANFKRQAQALTILTIGTVIIGGALFQAGLSIKAGPPEAQWLLKGQVALILVAAIAYLFLLFGTNDVLNQTTAIQGSDITYKLMNPLAIEIFAAIIAFYIGGVNVLL